MEEGTLAKWLKKEGDPVASGDIVAEIETDKATMEVEAVDEGTLGRILVEAGTEGVKVNAPIAVILEEGESADDIDMDAIGGGAPAQPEPKAKTTNGAGDGATEAMAAAGAGTPSTAGGGPDTAGDSGPGGYGARAPASGGEAASRSKEGDRIKVSPLARRMAKNEGLDLSQLNGSGPKGRIVKRDIEKALKEGTGKGAPAPMAAMPAAGVDERLYPADSYEAIKNDGMRKVIAKRLHQSFNQEVPHFPLTIDCELTALMEARERINSGSPAKGEPGAYKISVNDFIIKAAAMALKKVPAANATYTDEAILRHRHADIGVAVAIDGGLITPIVWKAETKGLMEISEAVRDLAQRARQKKLKPEEYQGGTFAVSNLGMFGIKSFASIVNQPHGAIMSVGAGEERAVVRGGQIVPRLMMTITLTCDHRVVDGAVGAEYLAAFRQFVEEPAAMLL
jgi:pyruvate dehydrogenase E2 component (dihydrolipoamide acetyltransferase)